MVKNFFLRSVRIQTAFRHCRNAVRATSPPLSIPLRALPRASVDIAFYFNRDFLEYFEEKSTQKSEKIVKTLFLRSAQISLEINVGFFRTF